MKNSFLTILVSAIVLISCTEKQKGNRLKKENDFTKKGEAFFNQGDTASTSKDKTPKISVSEKNTYKPSESAYDWSESVNKKNNLYKQAQKDLYLAATKLCQDFDYKETFGYERSGYGNYQRKNGDTKIVINDACAAFFPSPYVTPMEYYYKLFDNYNEIETYKNNSFKLKEIREKFNSKYQDSFNELLRTIDTKDVISYSIARATIQEYDFESKRLRLSIGINNDIRVINYGEGPVADVRSITKKSWQSLTHYISMSEEEAKAIYEYYENRGDKGTPFNLFCKTFYELRKPQVQKRRNRFRFEAIIKRIEFYKEFDAEPLPSLKIGTLIF